MRLLLLFIFIPVKVVFSQFTLPVNDSVQNFLFAKSSLDNPILITLNGIYEYKSKWEYQSNLYDTIKNSDALVLLTEWEIYKNIDWEWVSHNVKNPFWIFDTRLILKDKEIQHLGMNIWQLGNYSRHKN